MRRILMMLICVVGATVAFSSCTKGVIDNNENIASISEPAKTEAKDIDEPVNISQEQTHENVKLLADSLLYLPSDHITYAKSKLIGCIESEINISSSSFTDLLAAIDGIRVVGDFPEKSGDISIAAVLHIEIADQVVSFKFGNTAVVLGTITSNTKSEETPQYFHFSSELISDMLKSIVGYSSIDQQGFILIKEVNASNLKSSNSLIFTDDFRKQLIEELIEAQKISYDFWGHSQAAHLVMAYPDKNINAMYHDCCPSYLAIEGDVFKVSDMFAKKLTEYFIENSVIMLEG